MLKRKSMARIMCVQVRVIKVPPSIKPRVVNIFLKAIVHVKNVRIWLLQFMMAARWSDGMLHNSAEI